MAPRKKRPPGYNRRVMCGYVSSAVVLKGYERLVRRINAVAKGKHKVTVSALVGRLIERMLPFLIDQTPETLAAELAKETSGAKAKPAR